MKTLALRRSVYVPARLGIRRNPEDVLKTHAGALYGATAANLAPVTSFLDTQYAIPQDLALQVLTHKLFANGIKPYNEKLSVMGAKLMSLVLAKHVTDPPSASAMAVLGKNLDALGTPMARELGGRMLLGVFAQRHNLNKVMFWKLYNHSLSFERSGELKVSAQMMYALIGAVAFTHGKAKAEQFVREKLLTGENSVEAICASFLL